ncbi:MAG: hypothetical protein L3J82_02565 [Planctomycetes bacterium]|nr:hypothetical protein [Planctomycetota bacterium]
MKNYLRIPALVAAFVVLAVTSAYSQDVPDAPATAVIEINIANLSRGYARPLRKTAQRMQALEGIEKVEMLGWVMGTASFKVTTSLDQEQLESALGLRFVCKTGTGMLFAPEVNASAKRAEARAVVSRISRAVLDLYENAETKEDEDGNETYLPVLQEYPRLKDKLKALNISIGGLDGKFYSIDDYHIEEESSSWELSCKIWAGDNWYDFGGRRGYAASETSTDERFVGMAISCTPYGGISKRWVDKDAAPRNEGIITRADKHTDPYGGRGFKDAEDAKEELVIKYAERVMKNYMAVAVSYWLHNPKKKIGELNSMDGWDLENWWDEKFEGDSGLDNWRGWPRGLNRSNMNVNWLRKDGTLQLVGKIADESHPLFLHAVVDVSAVRDTYIILDELPEGKADIESEIEWVVGAEDESVFIERRANAKELHASIARLVFEYVNKPEAESLQGSLNNAALCQRIGYAHSADYSYKPEQLTLRVQLFGDIEISVGTPRTGGTFWALVNPKTGKIFRSHQ